jgi:hypothetical protein
MHETLTCRDRVSSPRKSCFDNYLHSLHMAPLLIDRMSRAAAAASIRFATNPSLLYATVASMIR